MASINKVIIVGNVGRDPETRIFPNGDAVTNVTVATTEKWRDKTTQEMKEHTEWHKVQFTGRTAEIAAKYVKKGSSIYAEGKLKTRKWTDQSGVEKYSTEIHAFELQLLGGRPEGAGAGAPAPRAAAPAPARAPAAAQGGYDDDSEIPF